ncbi:MAG: hypothetical protein U0T69_07120 [Chitinophagales bacterium]
MNTLISNKAIVSNNVIIGNGTQIGDKVVLHENVIIGRNCILEECDIGEGTIIEDNCIIGYGNATGFVSRVSTVGDLAPLEIGKNCLIREGCTIYKGSVFGEGVKIHHKVLIREKTIIGDYTSIGSMCDLEGNLRIGHNCSIHSNVHLCFDTTIGDYVFIAPFTVTTNGNPMGYKRPFLHEKFGYEKGPIIESGCQIAVHVTVLPRVRVGYESMIGANSLIVKDVEALSIMLGSPAKKRGIVEELYRLPIEIRNQLGHK